MNRFFVPIFLAFLIHAKQSEFAAHAASVECTDGIESLSTKVINSEAFYPESPIQVGGYLYYVEYTKNRVMFYDGTKNNQVWIEEGCGPAAITSYQSNRFLVACYDSNKLVLLSLSGRKLSEYSMPSPNDFAHDATGGVYVTSSSADGSFVKGSPATGRVFYLDGISLRGVEGIRPIHYSNGVAVSSDGRYLFVSETLKNEILKFRILGPGRLRDDSFLEDRRIGDSITFRFPFVGRVPDLLGPDGLRVDSRGNLFVAQFAGGRILKLKSNKKAIGVIHVLSLDPGVSFPNITNLWVDGDTITIAASQNLPSEKYPGIIFQVIDPRLTTRANLDCVIFN